MEKLLFLRDCEAGLEFKLRIPGITSVGRAGNNDIQPESMSVSKAHAAISVTTDMGTIKDIWVEDLNSRNGTFVGHPGEWEKVRDRRKVKLDDGIKFGNCTKYYILTNKALVPVSPEQSPKHVVKDHVLVKDNLALPSKGVPFHRVNQSPPSQSRQSLHSSPPDMKGVDNDLIPPRKFQETSDAQQMPYAYENYGDQARFPDPKNDYNAASHHHQQAAPALYSPPANHPSRNEGLVQSNVFDYQYAEKQRFGLERMEKTAPVPASLWMGHLHMMVPQQGLSQSVGYMEASRPPVPQDNHYNYSIGAGDFPNILNSQIKELNKLTSSLNKFNPESLNSRPIADAVCEILASNGNMNVSSPSRIPDQQSQPAKIPVSSVVQKKLDNLAGNNSIDGPPIDLSNGSVIGLDGKGGIGLKVEKNEVKNPVEPVKPLLPPKPSNPVSGRSPQSVSEAVLYEGLAESLLEQDKSTVAILTLVATDLTNLYDKLCKGHFLPEVEKIDPNSDAAIKEKTTRYADLESDFDIAMEIDLGLRSMIGVILEENVSRMKQVVKSTLLMSMQQDNFEMYFGKSAIETAEAINAGNISPSRAVHDTVVKITRQLEGLYAFVVRRAEGMGSGDNVYQQMFSAEDINEVSVHVLGDVLLSLTAVIQQAAVVMEAVDKVSVAAQSLSANDFNFGTMQKLMTSASSNAGKSMSKSGAKRSLDDEVNEMRKLKGSSSVTFGHSLADDIEKFERENVDRSHDKHPQEKESLHKAGTASKFSPQESDIKRAVSLSDDDDSHVGRSHGIADGVREADPSSMKVSDSLLALPRAKVLSEGEKKMKMRGVLNMVCDAGLLKLRAAFKIWERHAREEARQVVTLAKSKEVMKRVIRTLGIKSYREVNNAFRIWRNRTQYLRNNFANSAELAETKLKLMEAENKINDLLLNNDVAASLIAEKSLNRELTLINIELRRSVQELQGKFINLLSPKERATGSLGGGTAVPMRITAIQDMLVEREDEITSLRRDYNSLQENLQKYEAFYRIDKKKLNSGEYSKRGRSPPKTQSPRNSKSRSPSHQRRSNSRNHKSSNEESSSSDDGERIPSKPRLSRKHNMDLRGVDDVCGMMTSKVARQVLLLEMKRLSGALTNMNDEKNSMKSELASELSKRIHLSTAHHILADKLVKLTSNERILMDVLKDKLGSDGLFDLLQAASVKGFVKFIE